MKLTTTIAIVVALGVLGAIFVAGCNSATDDEPTPTTSSSNDKPATETGTTVAYTNEKGELLCPVLGEVIPSAEKAAGFQDYEGKRYYFCCAGCPETFAADPAKYAK
ncbi:MAG: YHS domain-containing protein [Fimbriimonadaceae bacterium]